MTSSDAELSKFLHSTWARLMVRRSVVTVRRHTSPPPDTENQLDSWAVLEGLTALVFSL